jgi:predicted RNA binding protein YcfA (HicA-like mRNA interferase family)
MKSFKKGGIATINNNFEYEVDILTSDSEKRKGLYNKKTFKPTFFPNVDSITTVSKEENEMKVNELRYDFIKNNRIVKSGIIYKNQNVSYPGADGVIESANGMGKRGDKIIIHRKGGKINNINNMLYLKYQEGGQAPSPDQMLQGEFMQLLAQQYRLNSPEELQAKIQELGQDNVARMFDRFKKVKMNKTSTQRGTNEMTPKGEEGIKLYKKTTVELPKFNAGGHLKLLDHKGDIQMHMKGEERIYSRPHTKQLVGIALKADKEMERLGKAMVRIINKQNASEPEYVDDSKKKSFSKTNKK